ncbi:MAG: 4Fe-4S dicluster domain-containing protein [Desulfobacterales bacterium]|nr:4Fe-4S dicluster domain-containing protein [Desulfobacterales bacterium]
MDRIIPVESEIDVEKDEVLPAEEVRKIIDQFDTIAVATCYCRHEKDLLEDSCKFTDKRENCLMFGPGAQFTIDQKFARPVTKEEARRILKESEDAGLVHKSFHAKLDPEREQEAICSCCKCCCGTFQLYYRGVRAMHSVTSYLAKIDEDECTGCGVCVDMCPMEAIVINDVTAEIEEEKCLGCGVCAHHCDCDAATLVRTGKREVFVPPPRIATR